MVTPIKSTNVRTYRSPAAPPLALRAHRLGLRILSARAPALAAGYAERLFFTARRHRRPRWEQEVLASAARETVRHEEGSLPAWTWGERDRPAVVLVHGWEGRGSQLAAFVEPLLARGMRVVAFDAPGHGEASSARASLVEHARALTTVVRWAGDVHALVGHSVGGAATLLATRYGVSARRYALVAPPRSPAAFVSGFSRAFGLDDRVRARMIARIEGRYGLTLAELDMRKDAAKLERPLLVVHDEDDLVVPASDGSLLAGAAPRGRLVTTQGLGHRRVLRAAEVLEHVVHFVTDGTPAPSFAEALEGELFFRYAR
jgi:pimeloyl-ACP methyl ester carboxylesterase